MLSVGKFKYTQDPRMGVEHEPHLQTWGVSISDVEFSDEGVYECQVNTEPIRRHRVFLDVVGT